MKQLLRIICDFDGTITRQDSTDLVLSVLADPAWLALQDDWMASRISGAECMQGQVALIGGSARDLDTVLDDVDLDPGFAPFVDWCEQHAFSLSIVSDGVDYFIGRILARHGLARLPVAANHLAGEPGAWRLRLPWQEGDCANGSGVCKCSAAEKGATRGDETVVFVGDGRSDFCIAGRADILFAMGVLAELVTDQKRPYLPFDNFDDVRRSLAVLLGEIPNPLDHAAAAGG